MALKGNARKTYRTMRGKMVDMDQLQQRNELTPAVGNARVNARGDELGPGGKIIRKKEDLLKEYYENNNRVASETIETDVTKNNTVAKDTAPKTGVKSNNTVAKDTAPKTGVKSNKTTRAQQKVEENGIAEDPNMADEFGDNEDWVEDADGNFVPKG